MDGKYHIDDVHVSTFEAVDTRFLFRTGAADAAIAFMNPALSIATASENKNREQMTTSTKRIGF